MDINNIKQNIKNYIDEHHLKNIHELSFYEVLNVLMNFVQEGTHFSKLQHQKLAWVCNSVMGSGKTTAIKVLLKYLADNFRDIPLLLVFKETNLMLEVYEEINSYAKNKGIRSLIEYVETSNVNEVSQTLNQYQFICITQQRFRDLTLNFGNWNEYRVFIKGHKPVQRTIERLIIVDEMPIFLDNAIFDVSSKDNSVDWFDKLAEDNNFTADERQFARTMIMMLMTYEMLRSKRGERFTKPLINGVLEPKVEQEFTSIINRIDTEKGDFELIRKLRWFKRLLHDDQVGAIDRHSKGISILCAKYINYHKKGNIIILDGTAQFNQELYEKDYVIKSLTNYHKYEKRVKLYIRDINTSREVREKRDSEVHGKVAADLKKVKEEYRLSIFPLASKMDVDKYIDNQVIDEQQRQFYETRDKERDSLPINLLNTNGKNMLNKYNSLALLNLPIRNPQFYKLIGIAIYGVGIDLGLYERGEERENKTGWFKEGRMQKIYEGSLLSDMLQIIHRSSLRNIKEQSGVHIFFYTHITDWIIKLKESLDLSSASIFYDLADDKYNFLAKSEEFATKTRAFLVKQAEPFKNKSFSAKQIIKGENFKNFINKSWNDSLKRSKITEIFKEAGVHIVEEKKDNGQVWKRFYLSEEVHEKLFEKLFE